jgi:hypothetical protein
MTATRALFAAVFAAASLSTPIAAQQRSQAARVVFERTGYRLTSLGARVSVSARVFDARRRAVPTAPIAWRMADSAIARVSPSGVVQSRRVGRTKLWAISGQDSASALILVDQWAAKFDFAPSRLRFDAVGAKLPLRIRVRDAAGNPIANRARRTSACRSLNERVASLALDGQVLSRANGVTYIRCTDRGIADSVRVEVRQRPVRAEIANKLSFGPRTVGDTFRVRLRAFDQANDEIPDAFPTWASLNPGVASIDPLTGLARSMSPGDTKIIAQVGDITDTLNITVQSAGMVLQGGSASSDPGGVPIIGEATRSATLRLDLIFPVVGDTSRISLTARDAMGVLISNPERDVVLRSSNPSVVSVISDNRVIARTTGTAWIIATLGTLSDSMQVAPRSQRSVAIGTGTAGSTVKFERPVYDTVAARNRNRRQLDSARAAILRSSPVGRTRDRFVSLAAVAAQTSHSARLSPTVNERRSGMLFGGSLALAPHKRLVSNTEMRFGTLTGEDNIGEDMLVTEIEGQLTYWPATWFGLRGGYLRRSENTNIARQRWQYANASAVTRFSFVGGAVSTVSAISLFPWASFTGHLDAMGNRVSPNPTSLAGEVGMELQTRLLNAAVIYYVERFSFPELSGGERRDQFSMLRVRVGLMAGR